MSIHANANSERFGATEGEPSTAPAKAYTEADGAKLLLKQLNSCLGNANDAQCVDDAFASSLVLVDQALNNARNRVSRKDGKDALANLNNEQKIFEEVSKRQCGVNGLLGANGLMSIGKDQKVCLINSNARRAVILANTGTPNGPDEYTFADAANVLELQLAGCLKQKNQNQCMKQAFEDGEVLVSQIYGTVMAKTPRANGQLANLTQEQNSWTRSRNLLCETPDHTKLDNKQKACLSLHAISRVRYLNSRLTGRL
jgi:uncharacterized protein YecT (DUF1311 family)